MEILSWFFGAIGLWLLAAEAACRPRWEWLVTPLTVLGIGSFLYGSLELSRIW